MARQLGSFTRHSTLLWVSIGSTAVLLLINFIVIWNFGNGLTEGSRVFYWQHLIGQSFWLECLTLILVPLTTILWAGASLRRIKIRWIGIALAATLLLYGACVFINYLGFFGFRWLEPIGTVKLKNNIYQLARVIEYDSYTNYYLGECNHTGYQCVFHKVYRAGVFNMDIPEIELSDNKQYLIVKLNDEIIYTYDGIQEHCIRTEAGWCIEDLST